MIFPKFSRYLLDILQKLELIDDCAVLAGIKPNFSDNPRLDLFIAKQTRRAECGLAALGGSQTQFLMQETLKA